MENSAAGNKSVLSPSARPNKRLEGNQQFSTSLKIWIARILFPPQISPSAGIKRGLERNWQFSTSLKNKQTPYPRYGIIARLLSPPQIIISTTNYYFPLKLLFSSQNYYFPLKLLFPLSNITSTWSNRRLEGKQFSTSLENKQTVLLDFLSPSNPFPSFILLRFFYFLQSFFKMLPPRSKFMTIAGTFFLLTARIHSVR